MITHVRTVTVAGLSSTSAADTAVAVTLPAMPTDPDARPYTPQKPRQRIPECANTRQHRRRLDAVADAIETALKNATDPLTAEVIKLVCPIGTSAITISAVLRNLQKQGRIECVNPRARVRLWVAK
jgi:hypothetical protein